MEYTNVFHCINRLFLMSLTLALSGCATSFNNEAFSGDKLAHDFRENVVKITATWKDGSRNKGFGFIVGQGAGQVIVATANHVLRDMSVPLGDKRYGESLRNVAHAIEVQFFRQTSRIYNAQLLGFDDRQMDLGVIILNTPPNLSWRKDVISAQRPDRGTPVRFIGKQGKWEIPAAPGVVRGEEPPFLLIEDLNAALGTSGAPLLSDTGLIGMLVSDSLDATRVLPIATIADLLQNVVPWQLEEKLLEQPITFPLWVKIGGGILGALAVGALVKEPKEDNERAISVSTSLPVVP